MVDFKITPDMILQEFRFLYDDNYKSSYDLLVFNLASLYKVSKEKVEEAVKNAVECGCISVSDKIVTLVEGDEPYSLVAYTNKDYMYKQAYTQEIKIWNKQFNESGVAYDNIKLIDKLLDITEYDECMVSEILELLGTICTKCWNSMVPCNCSK